MKKSILVLITFFTIIVTVQQAEAQLKLSTSAVIGTELSIDDDGSTSPAFGLGVRGLYEVNPTLSISPGFTYFFPSSPEGFDLYSFVLDADIHYNFVKKKNNRLYAIGGLNYSYVDISSDLFGSNGDSASESKVGVDLGAGYRTGDRTQFISEVKYNTAFENIIASVGILFRL